MPVTFARMRNFFIAITLFIFLSLPQYSHAIGLSPAIHKANDLANGIIVEKIFKISRANPSNTIYYKVEAKGEGARYVTLSKDELELPKGVESVPYKIMITPEGAPNGAYNAQIVLTALPKVKEGELQAGNNLAAGNSVAVLDGVIGMLNFSITDKEIRRFNVSDVSSQMTEVNRPVVLYYSMRNSGNIDARPQKVRLRFTDLSDPTNIYETEVMSEELALVAPSQSENASFAVRTPLKEGRYRVEVNIFDKDTIIHTTDNLIIEILPEGTLAQEAEISSFLIDKEQFQIGELIKMTSIVKNTGEAPLDFLMNVEVYQGDQEIDFLSSDETLLLVGEEKELVLTFKGQEKGNYSFHAEGKYGIKKTEPIILTFRVGNPLNLPIILGYTAIALGILAILVLLTKKIFLQQTDEAPVKKVTKPKIRRATTKTKTKQASSVKKKSTRTKKATKATKKKTTALKTSKTTKKKTRTTKKKTNTTKKKSTPKKTS